MPATVWQLFSVKLIHGKRKYMSIWWNLLGKNSWNHINGTYFLAAFNYLKPLWPTVAAAVATAAAAAVTCLRNAYGTHLSSNGRGNISDRVRGRTNQALFYRLLADLVCYGVIGDIGRQQLSRDLKFLFKFWFIMLEMCKCRQYGQTGGT